MASIINATTTAGVSVQGDNSGELQLQTNSGTTAVTIDTSQNVTFAKPIIIGGNTLGAGNASSFKNRIINGAMVIDQRNAGASVTPTNGQYTLDRWYFTLAQTSKLTTQQSSLTTLAGFTNATRVTSSSAYTVGASEIFGFRQSIEGFNVADLNWGTANAKTVTLSFWVRSSLTGTFGGALKNSDSSRTYPFSYTISSASTFEYKTITIAGDTSGTWLTNNGVGINILFGLGVGATISGTAGAWSSTNFSSATGATSVVGTNGATWDITGVQLEVGSTATSFDYRPYGTELALCQRYGQIASQQQNSGDVCGTGANTNVKFQFPVTMRTSPTASLTTAGSWIVGNGYSANYTASSASIAGQATSPQGGRVAISGFTAFGSNFFVSGTDSVGTAVMFMSAEL